MPSYTYHVTDVDTGAPIQNANVKYTYNIPGGWFGVGGGAGNGSGSTDTSGNYSFEISGYNSGGSFSYDITANGYWEINATQTEGTITGPITHNVAMKATTGAAPAGQGLAGGLASISGAFAAAGATLTSDLQTAGWMAVVGIVAFAIILVVIFILIAQRPY
jgi:hypothetical protein